MAACHASASALTLSQEGGEIELFGQLPIDNLEIRVVK
jgi:hypothetical protein